MSNAYPKDQKAPPDDDVTLRRLVAHDAVALASLLAAYGDEMRHEQGAGANALARANALIADPIVEVLGGFLGDELVAFAVFFDLPEAISGGRSGQLDDLYVLPAARGKRLAQRLIAAIADIGRSRAWIHLRWLVPEDNPDAIRAYARFAEPAGWKSYVLWLAGSERW
ncbi:TPA: GNAT family N-acetyltransferase [Pseudomonas aeruginosa]|uniref:GNAT family N-acetyltransferase n=1 Tax=Pseudomonadota TaxID=1224 RepID=UPI001642DAC4|nr:MULTISPECIES: GNAT family N-acetyltransferase [Pseudomonadota]MBX6698921.1 GNAT family N-acetyltransferase [Pseudomonas aeruginosa]MDW5587535.1 GNAT family N-acetyltransferase [Pseudomonas aeruginosa]MDW5716213.1 GNAT family N-acetyltransferase [Pseudomonas aeruginosa]WMX08019.1 GNAT family N-acetyltransferase [Pseudomonas aeruginosa]HBN9505232.1 GNAT family N-acetyltransferase [Pseudomonas aeruginosa]